MEGAGKRKGYWIEEVGLHSWKTVLEKQTKNKQKKNALKGAVRDFFLQLPHCVVNCLLPGHNHVQITCSTQSAYHVQHVVCHMVPRDSSGIKSDRVDIAFILALFYWLNH